MRAFLSELRRRKVFRVAAVYAATAWILLQAANILGPALLLPDWVTRAVAFVILLGFPVAVLLAWAFEITPDGVKRTRSEATGSTAPFRSRGAAAMGLGGLLVVTFAFAAWKVAGNDRDATAPLLDGSAGESGDLVPGVEWDGGDLYAALLAKRGPSAVAVLPFTDLGPDTARAYFTAGIHDAVITALANVGELTVTSRTSVMPYAGTTGNVRAIADELDVTHIVEGTVQRAGGRVRVTVQLIDARTDRHVWAEQFDRGLTPDGVFEIQSGIAEQVARALEANLSPGERDQIERRPTENLEAWELYTRARHVARSPDDSPERTARAFAMLRRAAALDPAFALAHAEMGRLYAGEWGRTGEGRWRDSVQAAASRALRIDPSLPEAHLARASYHHAVGDLESERRATLRALELRPNSPEALSRLSRLEADAARLDRSLCLARRAVEVEPTEADGWVRLGFAYRDLGFFARAEEVFRGGLDRGEDTASLYRYLAALALAQDASGRALEYYRVRRAVGDSTAEALQVIAAMEWDLGWPDSASARFRRAEELGAEDRYALKRAAALLRTGDRVAAGEVLDRVEAKARARLESGAQDFFPYLDLMAVYAMRGNTDGAVDALEKAVERGFRILPWIAARPGSGYGSLPGMAGLESDARYRAIFTRLAAAQDSMRQIVERNGC